MKSIADHLKAAEELIEAADAIYESYEREEDMAHYDRCVEMAKAHALMAQVKQGELWRKFGSSW